MLIFIRKFNAVSLITLWLWMGTTAVSAQTDSLSIDVYWETLTQLQEQVDTLQTLPESEQVAQLATLAEQWEKVTAVTLPDGQALPVNHTHLITALQATPPDLTAIQSQIKGMIALQTSWPPAQSTAIDTEILSQILDRSEFDYEIPEPTRLQQWWQDMRLRMADFFARLLPAGEANRFLGNIILYGSIVMLALLLSFALRGILDGFASDAHLTAEQAADEMYLTADVALKRAKDHSTDGDYRTAVRYLYLSALLLLEERGLLRYDRSMTNREYLRSIAHQPHFSAILRDVIDVFDRVWYGFQPLSADEYESYVLRVEKLKQQRERG